MRAKRRGAGAYARKGPVREPYDLVLIVCEGTKTEPHYFGGLRLAERLSSANVVVTPADGSDPMSIVDFAIATAGDYDRIFCVFDRDGHANFDAARNKAAQCPLGIAGRLKTITSWPCFELWMLLHFRYSTAAIVRQGKRSAGDMACLELQRHVAAYEKGHKRIYMELAPRIEQAMIHARRLQRDNQRTGSTNPSTSVHELVEFLRCLRAAGRRRDP